MRVPRAHRFRTTKLRGSCGDENPEKVKADALKTSEREAGFKVKSITFEREGREGGEADRGIEGNFKNVSQKDRHKELKPVEGNQRT